MRVLRALLALRRAATERDRAQAKFEAMAPPVAKWLYGQTGQTPGRCFFLAERYEWARAAACAADAAWFDAAVALAEALWPRR